MKIAILYGTETGNAEMLAEDVAAHLASHETTVGNLADTNPEDLRPGTFHIIVTSTYGEGELPASAKPFVERMAAARPDLSGILFAVFGLGDSQYAETFGFGGKRLEELLSAAGATVVGPRGTHDASGSDLAEDVALPWSDAVIAAAEALLSPAS